MSLLFLLLVEDKCLEEEYVAGREKRMGAFDCTNTYSKILTYISALILSLSLN